MISLFIIIKAQILLWFATKQADRAYKGEYKIGEYRDGTTQFMRPNVRYYIMPDENDKLICMNRQEFHKLRTKRQMSQDVLVKHLKKECFYYTPHANGRNPISEREKKERIDMYVDYCLQLRKKRKEKKKRDREYVRQVKKSLDASKNAPMRHY